MAARAMWKGRIRFGDVDVPVKLYSAIRSSSGLHFRLLHEKDLQPVKQMMVNPATGEIVDYEDVHRAFPTDDGLLVMLDEEELAALEPEASRDIEVTRFVDPEVITHAWYDRPYYLGPDDSDPEYFALAEALRRQKKEGIARWVMRKKEYVGALRLEGDYLMLMTLRHTGEVVPASTLNAPAGRALDKREVDMATQLVAALEGDLELEAYHDEYRERVLELVEAKTEGKVLQFPRAPRKKIADDSLSDILEQSLKAARKKATA
ncbi:MAG: Ku protein [Gemmatimonadetes bacterium]|nr:Ku protein [Gemmatimonadota bacterium]